MAEVTAGGTVSSDHRLAIRERLKQIRELFRVWSRYGPRPLGEEAVQDSDELAAGVCKGEAPSSGSAPEPAIRLGREAGLADGRATLPRCSSPTTVCPATRSRTDPEPDVRSG